MEHILYINISEPFTIIIYYYFQKVYMTHGGNFNSGIGRRMKSCIIQEETETVHHFGNLQVDLTARTVMKNNELVKLTSTEYSLLALLVRNEGKVLTHQYLLRAIWGPGYINQSQYLRVFIAQIRKKIEEDPNRPEHLITESGVGYRFIGL